VIRIPIEAAPDRPDLFVSRIDWGTDPSLGRVEDYGAIFLVSEDRKPRGLAPATTYSYRVTLMDPAGNAIEDPVASVATAP